MKRAFYILFLFTLPAYYNCYAQVGIGNLSPDSTSVLDLTNTQNRGLILPSSATVAAMTESVKAVYFFNDYIYFKTSLGYNAFSPWKYKFNGNTSSNLYFNLIGNVGIGNTDITSAPEAPLQIETNNAVDLGTSGSFMIGEISGTNMIVNSSEIQTRDAGVSSELKINEDGGNVTFGDINTPVDVFVSGKVQELDDATNSYYNLVPPGIITAWFGVTANIPKGWAICDGGTYNNTNGIGTTTTPNLSGRFIVSVGDNGENSYAAHNTGGEDKVSLAISEIPSHGHNTRTTGAHSHSFSYKSPKMHSDGDNASDYSFATGHDMVGGGTSTGYANISQGNGGTGQAHENRPVYYSLVYIMKL